MSKDYNLFLAAQVLNDEKLVTYRHVARAMGVCANEAKQMLFEFHRRENLKKAGSVHANYLLSGLRRSKNTAQANGDTTAAGQDDVEMASSPFPGSSMPHEAGEEQSLCRALTLVREEQLSDAKEQYVKLLGIHVYSLQPSSIKNLESISNANEEIYKAYIGEDPFIKGKTWGLIQNPNAKRRTGARPPPPPPTTSSTATKPKASAPSAVSSVPNTKQENPVSTGSTASTGRPPALKKENSSLFKSFAKSKTKPKVNDEEDIEVEVGGPQTDSSARGAHSMPVSSMGEDIAIKQDVHLTDDQDDDEDEEDDYPAPKAGAAKPGRTKSEKDAELRRKIFDDDDEDEDMPDAPMKEEPEGDDASAPDEDDAEEADTVDAKSVVKEEQEPSEQVTVSNGRRRGKRRVTKTRTIKDAEGYLVSREEMAWESFSEDDVPAPKPSTATAPTSSNASKKAAPAKRGQGNIMAFFGKK